MWQTLEMLGSGNLHMVLYFCKHWGFGWFSIYSGGVTLSTGATSLEQMFVLLAFRPALACDGSLLLHQDKPSVLSGDVKPLVSFCGKCKPGLVSPWNTAVDIAEVWTLCKVPRLGQSQCFCSICLDSQVQNNCVENPASSGINSLLL